MALLVMLAVALPMQSRAAETLKGVALVIGQSKYAHLPTLPNPANDARAIEQLLNELGFDTTVRDDRDAAELKRDLERFLEDAESADVAVLYYAGHGIEAGGENFLLPIDTDLGALDAAAEKLVSLSASIERLQAAAPVVVVLLDACRTNPFPAGSAIRLSADSPALPVAASGLGEARSAVRLPDAGTDGTERFGIVIGLAATPGRAALDGPPGGNSPYTAAILKHLAAMAGAEFGDVMQMVGEEVYLKTSGRQQPWINASLRRLLYFGAAPEPVKGEEGEILDERRQLLLTIAALSDVERLRIEAVAANGGVPMDAVYGMLRALGVDAPADPAKLELLLRDQTARLKQLVAERAVLDGGDPEIMRLSKLADQAIAEGALATAISLHESAKTRVGALEQTVETAEAAIKARRIEFAAVFAKTAEAYALSFDRLKAAEDYERAFQRVERWDDHLAWAYKHRAMVELTRHGEYYADTAVLEKAIAAGEEALRLSWASRLDWATTQKDLGDALRFLGGFQGDPARLKQAAAAYRAAIEEFGQHRDSAPLDWAAAQYALGKTLGALGDREDAEIRYKESIAAYRAALEEYSPENAPVDWPSAQNALGATLVALGDRTGDTALLEAGIAAYRAAQQVWTLKGDGADWQLNSANWQVAEMNIARALEIIGTRESGTAGLEKAAAAYRSAARGDYEWVLAHNHLGNVLQMIAEREGGTARLVEAVSAHRAALRGFRTDGTWRMADWAKFQNDLGNALLALGRREESGSRIEEAVAAFQSAIEEFGHDRPHQGLRWALAQGNLGRALEALGQLEAAVAAHRQALVEYPPDRFPIDWAWTQYNVGNILMELGRRGDQQKAVEGRQALQESWAAYREAGHSEYDDDFRARIAEADLVIQGAIHGERAGVPSP